MRKIILTFFALLFITSVGFTQVTTLWEKSAATTSLPSWFSASGNTERGLSYGSVGGNDRLYVVSRNNGSFVYIINALTGDSVGTLRTDGISGGLFPVNDVEVSSNGVVFVCNMTTDASVGTNPFKVYKYTTEADSPVVALSYNTTGTVRLGDKFTVTGSTADNSVTIWAASGNTKELYKFTTTDNGVTFTPTIVQLPSLGSTSLGSAAVGPLPNGNFYYNAGGQPAQKFLADGTIVDTISTGIIASGTNAIRFMSANTSDEFFATYAYGPTNETGRIVKIPGGDLDLAELLGVTPVLGTNGNVGGTGDLSVQRISNFIYNIYVLGTNNGFGAYQIDLRTQLSGDYYVGAAGTGPGGSDPDFPSLRDAFQVINNANITGDCTFYITSDITEVTTPGGIGLAVNPDPYTITFKPYIGVQPTITLPYTSDSNSGPSGAFIIGIPMENNIAWNDLRTTKNIVFDGSNTVGGTTRDLTITNLSTSARNAFPVTIVGDVSNLTIKNCNVYYQSAPAPSTSNLFIAAIQVRARNNGGLDWVPSDITIENNFIDANFTGNVRGAQGIVTVLLGTATAQYVNNLTIANNIIEGKQRAIALGYSANTDIYGNELILNQDVEATVANQAIVAANILAGSEINIYDNVISSISSLSNGTGSGNTGISIESAGTYDIYNNMITGFELTAVNPTANLRGISVSSTATVNLYYNTVYMNNIADIGTGAVAYNGLLVSDGTTDLKNNIVISAESDFATYCINRPGTAGTFTSNYNNFYPVSVTNGNVGFWDATATPTLANWQTASGQDANSKSKEVFFVSTTDLHLTGASLGDFDLAGTPIAGITTDIDGDTRGAMYPYMGADEGSVPLTFVEFWTENFDYPAGELLTDHGWTAHSGSGTNSITVNTFGLEFPGYAQSGIGLSALMDNTGEDVHRLFPEVTSGTVYTSFMARIDAAPTGYFLHYAPNPHNTFDFRGRVWVKTDGSGGLAVGYSFQSADTIFTNFDYTLGETLLFVSKYESVAGDNNDIASLYIFSVGDPISGTEPITPTIGPITNPGTGQADINPGSINLRQYNSGQNIIVDGIKVATSWDQVIPVELTSFSATADNGNVTLKWTTASETNNRGFEIERSTNGEFVTIGFVEGAGTSVQEKTYNYVDPNLVSGTYSYRLKQIDFNGTFEYSNTIEVDVTAPTVFELAQNYPNPFNPNTVIEYSIASPVNVTLTVYTILGEQVAVLVNNQFSEAGKYSVNFNASSLASGTYIYRLQAGDFVSTKKMLLTK